MLIALRRAHAVFRRRQFLYGRETEGSGLPDAAWFRSDGARMTDEDWGGATPVVGVFLNGEEIASPDSRGRQVLDESFLLLFNGHHETCEFTTPDGEFGDAWTIVFDTGAPGASRPPRRRSRRARRSSWSTTRWSCCDASRDDRSCARRTGCS